MKKIDIKDFDDITIAGRYIYGFLCLDAVLDETLPQELDRVLRDFVSKEDLNSWLDEAQEVLPSKIQDESYDETDFDFLDFPVVLKLRDFYASLGKVEIDLVENLIILGKANMFGGYDSEITLEHLEDILRLLENTGIPLPPFSKIEHCKIDGGSGWGDLADMSDYI